MPPYGIAARKQYAVRLFGTMHAHPLLSKRYLRQYIHISKWYGPTEVWWRGLAGLQNVTSTLNTLEGSLFCSICGWALSIERRALVSLLDAAFLLNFILFMCVRDAPLGKLIHGTDQGCLFKNNKCGSPSSVTVLLQRPESCPLSPCAIFTFPEAITVGIPAAAAPLCLGVRCIFDCMVRCIISQSISVCARMFVTVLIWENSLWKNRGVFWDKMKPWKPLGSLPLFVGTSLVFV